MPFNPKNYPDNWKEISNHIRFVRAKGKCEKCGLIHDGLRWNGKRFVEVVLTTAHIGLDKPDGSPGSKYDTMDCRVENLIALCDRCHLAFDADQHFLSRTIRERAALVAAGQQNLFEGLTMELEIECPHTTKTLISEEYPFARVLGVMVCPDCGEVFDDSDLEVDDDET